MRSCKFQLQDFANKTIQEKPRSLLYLLFCLVFIAAFSSSVYSQSVSTRLSGTVKDQSDAVVAGAKVTLTDVGSRDVKTTTTNDQGVFTFTDVRVGSYIVTG